MTSDTTAVHRAFPQAAFIHPSALLFGTLWLHESVSAGLLIALALVAGGIVLVNRR